MRKVLILVLVVASLGFKLLRHEMQPADSYATAFSVLAANLGREGWQDLGETPLTANGSVRARLFGKAGCDRPLVLALLPASGEADALFRLSLGGREASLVPLSGLWFRPVAGVHPPIGTESPCALSREAAARSLRLHPAGT